MPFWKSMITTAVRAGSRVVGVVIAAGSFRVEEEQGSYGEGSAGFAVCRELVSGHAGGVTATSIRRSAADVNGGWEALTIPRPLLPLRGSKGRPHRPGLSCPTHLTVDGVRPTLTFALRPSVVFCVLVRTIVQAATARASQAGIKREVASWSRHSPGCASSTSHTTLPVPTAPSCWPIL